MKRFGLEIKQDLELSGRLVAAYDSHIKKDD